MSELSSEATCRISTSTNFQLLPELFVKFLLNAVRWQASTQLALLGPRSTMRNRYNQHQRTEIRVVPRCQEKTDLCHGFWIPTTHQGPAEWTMEEFTGRGGLNMHELSDSEIMNIGR